MVWAFSSLSVMVEVEGDREKALRVPRWVSLNSVGAWRSASGGHGRNSETPMRIEAGHCQPESEQNEQRTLGEFPRHYGGMRGETEDRDGRGRSWKAIVGQSVGGAAVGRGRVPGERASAFFPVATRWDRCRLLIPRSLLVTDWSACRLMVVVAVVAGADKATPQTPGALQQLAKSRLGQKRARVNRARLEDA